MNISYAQSPDSSFYNIGTINVTDYYINPVQGNDNNSGLSRNSPKRSVTNVWNQIPQNSNLSIGVRINLLPGEYNSSHLPNYWENRLGTANAPIILQATDKYGTVSFVRDINMAGVKYFYLIGVDIKNDLGSGNFADTFHCERCEYILLRGNSFNGAPNGRNVTTSVAQETIKFNQSKYVYIENNNIQGASDNAIDWVSVQYGHIIGNRISDSQSWCAYVKGGSSYILIEANIISNCGEGGVTAGQGTGFEFMISPWLQYEANYVKVINNIIHDVEGAAFGVNGGNSILFAYNTAYKIGSRSHVFEAAFGERSCDGDIAGCLQKQLAGGWGPSQLDNPQPIGNRDVIVANNIFFNPEGFESRWQHFAIYGPRNPSIPSIPSPQRTDAELSIFSNIVWNGTNSMPTGIEEAEEGCQNSNATCNLNQLQNQNSFNVFRPDFVNPNAFDFRPSNNGNLSEIISVSIPSHAVFDPSLLSIPLGERNNIINREFSGELRSVRPPGAIAGFNSSIGFPNSGVLLPMPGVDGETQDYSPLLVRIKKLSSKRKGPDVVLLISARVTGGNLVSRVYAKIGQKKPITLKLKKASNYFAKVRLSLRKRKISVRVFAEDTTGGEANFPRRFFQHMR